MAGTGDERGLVMCTPLALMATSLAIQTAGTIAQHQATNDAADAQEKIIKDGYEKERQQTLRQYAEQQEASMDEQSQRYRDHQIEEGRLRVIGAESGISGGTNDRILQEAQNAYDADVSRIEGNRRRATEQAHSVGVSRQSHAQVQLSGVRRSSGLAAGLQIAGAGVDAYRAYDRHKQAAMAEGAKVRGA